MAKEKNWALKNLPFSHEWVLILDADECLPAQAEEEVRKIVTQSGGEACWVLDKSKVFLSR